MNKKEILSKALISFLNCAETMVELQKSQAKTKEEKSSCNKLIKRIRKFIELVPQYKHEEILKYLYESFISPMNMAFIYVPTLIVSKQLLKKDRNEKEFKQFLNDLNEQKQKAKVLSEERIKTQEAIKKARQEGKKVEMMYQDGKIKPVILENENQKD